MAFPRLREGKLWTPAPDRLEGRLCAGVTSSVAFDYSSVDKRMKVLSSYRWGMAVLHRSNKDAVGSLSRVCRNASSEKEPVWLQQAGH